MIVGIGTDICDISRIESVIKRQANFIERVLTESELMQYHQRKQPGVYIASRFAAKEAALKALGTGLAEGIRWKDVEVSNLESGQPVLEFFGRALEIAQQRGVSKIHLSLSDEQTHAIAFVILES